MSFLAQGKAIGKRGKKREKRVKKVGWLQIKQKKENGKGVCCAHKRREEEPFSPLCLWVIGLCGVVGEKKEAQARASPPINERSRHAFVHRVGLCCRSLSLNKKKREA